jgi:hypothetical protein
MVLLLVLMPLTACGGSFYNVPKDQYREQVKTLGVVPLLIDGQSTIRHPAQADVVGLLRRHSADRYQELIALLKTKKGYFDVRDVPGDPQRLFGRLIRSRSLREAPEGSYNHYEFAAGTVAELCRQGAVDALLVVVLNGTVRTEKRWDRTRLSYLEAPFNDILATAAVVLPSGEVLWEYQGPAAEPFLALQYADFDEAYHNKTEEVALHFTTVAGLDRTLVEPGRDWFQETLLPRPYQELFQDLVKQLSPGLLDRLAPRPAAQ